MASNQQHRVTIHSWYIYLYNVYVSPQVGHPPTVADAGNDKRIIVRLGTNTRPVENSINQQKRFPPSAPQICDDNFVLVPPSRTDHVCVHCEQLRAWAFNRMPVFFSCMQFSFCPLVGSEVFYKCDIRIGSKLSEMTNHNSTSFAQRVVQFVLVRISIIDVFRKLVHLPFEWTAQAFIYGIEGPLYTFSGIPGNPGNFFYTWKPGEMISNIHELVVETMKNKVNWHFNSNHEKTYARFDNVEPSVRCFDQCIRLPAR